MDNKNNTKQPPPTPPRSDVIEPSVPPKEPIAALLLNVFFVCVGYFLIGQWQKGAVAAFLFVVALVGAVLVSAVTAGCGSCVVIPLYIAFHAFLVVDCYLQATALQSGKAVGQWTFFNSHL